MKDWIKNREEKLRGFFELAPETELISQDKIESFDVSESIAEHLKNFNLEWHIIPAETAISVEDESYRKRLYPLFKRELKSIEYKKTSSYRAVIDGHQRHQGRIIGVETTAKPKYLPENRQLYGTPYGFEPRVDPFKPYMEKAGFTTGTRFGHNYTALRKFINIVNDDWNLRLLMPKGFRLTICPPVIFNLIGTVFHQEWSQTESLELGFYRDENGNAKCYAVGSNAPDDFSYISEIETTADWTYLGFRIALVSNE
ncbi:hypothetical protein BH18ACI1_BH18ACI1_08640 [soil metagenome]